MSDLKYKGFRGTVTEGRNGFSGYVKGINGGAVYFGMDKKELIKNFKCRVDYIIHACDQAYINPLSLINCSPYKNSKKMFIGLTIAALTLLTSIVIFYINVSDVQPILVVSSAKW